MREVGRCSVSSWHIADPNTIWEVTEEEENGWILGGKLAAFSAFSTFTGYICLTSPPSQDHGFLLLHHWEQTSHFMAGRAAGSCSSKALWRFSGLGSTGLWRATLMQGALGQQLRRHPWKDRRRGAGPSCQAPVSLTSWCCLWANWAV